MLRAARGEGGQVLVLAGAVLVLALLMAAFSVGELAAQEAQLQQAGRGELPELFRETRDEFAASMKALTIPSTTNATFLNAFDAQRAEFEERGRSHGLFIIISLSNGTDPFAPKREKDHFSADDASAQSCGGSPEVKRKLNAWSHDGGRDYRSKSWDCSEDGILWDRDISQVSGFVAYFFLANEVARMEETVVVAVN